MLFHNPFSIRRSASIQILSSIRTRQRLRVVAQLLDPESSSNRARSESGVKARAIIHWDARAQSIDTSWAEARVALADPDRLLRLLADLDKDRHPAERVEWARRLCAATDSAAELTPERLLPLSHGAAALCEWVLAVCAYHDAHVEAEPRRLDLEAPNLAES